MYCRTLTEHRFPNGFPNDNTPEITKISGVTILSVKRSFFEHIKIYETNLVSSHFRTKKHSFFGDLNHHGITFLFAALNHLPCLLVVPIKARPCPRKLGQHKANFVAVIGLAVYTEILADKYKQAKDSGN